MLRRLLIPSGFLVLLLLPAHGLEWKTTAIEIEANPLDEGITATFEFTNTATTPLTITDIRSSCGCTVPDLAKRTYAPGESGELNVVFTFNALTGRQTKTVTVETNEPQSPSYPLRLQVDIPKLFELDRHFLMWRTGEPAEAKSLPIHVLRPDLIALESVEVRDERFTGRIEPTDKPDVFNIVITPAGTEQSMQGTIVVKSNFPAKNPRVITLYALVR